MNFFAVDCKILWVVRNSLARSASLPVFRDTGSYGGDAELLEFPREGARGSLSAGRSLKTFPDMGNEWNRGLPTPRQSGPHENSVDNQFPAVKSGQFVFAF